MEEAPPPSYLRPTVCPSRAGRNSQRKKAFLFRETRKHLLTNRAPVERASKLGVKYK